MNMLKDDLDKEKRTILAMVRIYCSGHHQREDGDVCSDCQGLIDYAYSRLDRCKFGLEKPICSKCTVHCYKPEMRQKVRAIMRYAGPRMLLRHPMMAIGHFARGRKAIKDDEQRATDSDV